MLAYVFWHRPREGTPAEEYERALETFHRSLDRQPPAGMSALASYRLSALPWQASDRSAGGDAPEVPGVGAATAGLAPPAYEDWYLVADYASLGVLNEAAAGRGHRSPHDEVATMAEAHFVNAAAAMEQCSRRAMRPAAVMGAVYHASLDRLRRRGWARLDVPVSLPRPVKIWLALRHGLL